MPKQPKKVKVPPEAPAVLVTLNQKIRVMRQELAITQQELMALTAAGQAYARSVRLDPAKNYRFEAKDEKLYAIEQPVVAAPEEGAEKKE